jgi:hypothetical protein
MASSEVRGIQQNTLEFPIVTCDVATCLITAESHLLTTHGLLEFPRPLQHFSSIDALKRGTPDDLPLALRSARPGVSAMDASGDSQDLFSDGATPAFDGSDLPDSFWAELEENHVPYSAPHIHQSISDAEVPQQHTAEERAEEDDRERENQPRLLMQHEWDGTTQPPSDNLRYTVEWKAVMNTKRIGMDTDEDVFLAPEAYWNTKLQGKIDEALGREFALQDRPDPCSTAVVVSVNKRAERDLTKEFTGLEVDWSVIAEKLESWACYFGEGKRLLVRLTLRFRPRNGFPRAGAAGRGRQSATQRMRYGQALQRDAEEHASGQGAHWRHVYSILRCPGRPCQNNQGYDWRDPRGGKHYKLLTVHLRRLVEHVMGGNKLDSHNDIPDHVRQQLYAEADQHASRCQDARRTPAPMQQSQAATQAATTTPEQASSTAATIAPAVLESLDIPGPHEDAIRNYVLWQQGQATSDEWISQYAKAGDILLKQGFKLGLFYERQLVDVLTDEGILRGIAWKFHSEIPKWLSENRSASHASPVYTSETPSGSFQGCSIDSPEFLKCPSALSTSLPTLPSAHLKKSPKSSKLGACFRQCRRINALSCENNSSMGFKSGEYGDKK